MYPRGEETEPLAKGRSYWLGHTDHNRLDIHIPAKDRCSVRTRLRGNTACGLGLWGRGEASV